MALNLNFVLWLSIFNFHHHPNCAPITCTADGCTCDPLISGEACILNCDAGVCRRDAITCRDGDPCTINCDGAGACRNAVITCPFASECSVTCTAHARACQGLQVTLNQAKSYKCTQTAPGACEPTPLPFTASPTLNPTKTPSIMPSISPSIIPTISPSLFPTRIPTVSPSLQPTLAPVPTLAPSDTPSQYPSQAPVTIQPSISPTNNPTIAPSIVPSLSPTNIPTISSSDPTASTFSPSLMPSLYPTTAPSKIPTAAPSNEPSSNPSQAPSLTPSLYPTTAPSKLPTAAPSTVNPSKSPSDASQTPQPTVSPSKIPSIHPIIRVTTTAPNIVPSPTYNPTQNPLNTQHPSLSPSKIPSKAPIAPTTTTTNTPTNSPTVVPSRTPTTIQPTSSPTSIPSAAPTEPGMTRKPSNAPSPKPSQTPSSSSSAPTTIIGTTIEPSTSPMEALTSAPTTAPSQQQTQPSNFTVTTSTKQSVESSKFPTLSPTVHPSNIQATTTTQLKEAEIKDVISTTADLSSNDNYDTSGRGAINPLIEAFSELWFILVVVGGLIMIVICIGLILAWYVRKTVRQKVELAHRVSLALNDIRPNYKQNHERIRSQSSTMRIRKYTDKRRLHSVASVSLPNSPSALSVGDENMDNLSIAPVSCSYNPQDVKHVALKSSDSVHMAQLFNIESDLPSSNENSEQNINETMMRIAEITQHPAVSPVSPLSEPQQEPSPLYPFNIEDTADTFDIEDTADMNEIVKDMQVDHDGDIDTQENMFVAGLRGYNDAVRRDSEFEHKTHQSTGINAIKQNIVRRISNTFNQELVQDNSDDEDEEEKAEYIDEHKIQKGSKVKQLTQIDELEVDNEINEDGDMPKLRDYWTNEREDDVSDRKSITISEMRHSASGTIDSCMRDVVGLTEDSMIVSLSVNHDDSAVPSSPYLGDNRMRQGTLSFHRRLTCDVLSSSHVMDGILDDMAQMPEM